MLSARDPASREALEPIVDRISRAHRRQRLHTQIFHAGEVFGQGTTLFHIENAEWLHVLVYWGLKATGLYRKGARAAKRIRAVEHRVRLPRLPASFEGYRLLHLSDLHIDLDPGFLPVLIERVQGLEYDACVLTGDYRADVIGPYDLVLDAMEQLRPHIKSEVYAVLGNHDFLEFVAPMEEMGYRFLLNENAALERGGEAIYLAGVDDPHLYEADNFHGACEGIPAEAVIIGLCHSPETYRKAAACGLDLMLCGHTHAGQICLPGGVPVMRNGRCPRSMIKGAWEHQGLKGYTSPGTGSCGVPIRFFCPPEATIHVLTRGKAAG